MGAFPAMLLKYDKKPKKLLMIFNVSKEGKKDYFTY
jgi:hypothetical protein